MITQLLPAADHQAPAPHHAGSTAGTSSAASCARRLGMVAKAGRGLHTPTSHCALPADDRWSHPEQLEQQVARR